MYHRRFKSSSSRKLLNLNGRFSVTHLGGASFLYTYPGKSNLHVGKLELGSGKYRLPLGIAGLFLTGLTLAAFTGESQRAVAMTSDQTAVEKTVSSRDTKAVAELEEQSEELKSKILKEEEKSRKKDEDKGPVKILNYRIKPGDTLSELATRYNVEVKLIAANSGIKPYDMLKPGQELTIPNKPGLMYSIKKGESLAHVAQKYHVKLDKIIDQNPELASMDLFEPGTSIFLPDAQIPDPPSPWRRPAYGRVTSNYGWRRHPILKRRAKHAGIDIGIYYRPVYAAKDGQVIYSGYLGSYGKVVVIRHSSTYKTLYAHLSRLKVRKGQYVKAGRMIAISGNTGLSTGPHLHFELIKNGVAINPRRLIRF